MKPLAGMPRTECVAAPRSRFAPEESGCPADTAGISTTEQWIPAKPHDRRRLSPKASWKKLTKRRGSSARRSPAGVEENFSFYAARISASHPATARNSNPCAGDRPVTSFGASERPSIPPCPGLRQPVACRWWAGAWPGGLARESPRRRRQPGPAGCANPVSCVPPRGSRNPRRRGGGGGLRSRAAQGVNR
jgi:hypothetical protein